MERGVNGLRLDEQVEEERGKAERGKKSSDGDSCSSSGGGAIVTTKERKGEKPLKGKQKKKFDPKFMIKEGAITEGFAGCRDARTTLMIKNIPNKYR